MRIISRKMLREFWEKHSDSRQPLMVWYADVKRANWSGRSDIKAVYPKASFLVGNRVEFKIKGSNYRIAVGVEYQYGLVFIRFIGTHQEYDRINAEKNLGIQMNIKPIRSEDDHEAALKEIEKLLGALPGSTDGDRLDILATLVEAYEDEHYPIPAPDPVETILYFMDSRGLTRSDLEPYIGSRARVSEILNRKRPLTLTMIQRLNTKLGIPAEALVKPYKIKIGKNQTRRIPA